MNQKVLISLMVIGVVGAVAGGSTLAVFNDEETSTGNAFAAGELDLRIDWQESINGEVIDRSGYDGAGPTDDPEFDDLDGKPVNLDGPIFNFNDIKPGDEGEATISLHLDTNPGYVWFRLNQIADSDGSSPNPECTEPELEEEPDCGTDQDGELDEHFSYVMWYDEDGDNFFDDGEKEITTTTTTEEEICRADVGLALDNSGSMYYTTFGGAEEEFEAEKDAAQQFVTDSFTGTGGTSSPEIGAVRFGGSAPETDQWPPVSELHPMSTDDTSINTAIGDLRPVGDFAEGISASDYPSKYEGTDLAGGIEEAADKVANEGRSSVSDDYVIVFSDGQQAGIQGDPVQAARDAENDHGVTVIAVAFQKQGGSNTDDFKQTMKDVATGSGESNFYFVPKGEYETLPDVFSGISDEICSTTTATTETGNVESGVRIDGDPYDEDNDIDPVGPASEEGVQYIGFKWQFDENAGNEVQTDELVYDMDFYTEQARNNGNPPVNGPNWVAP